MGARHAPCCAQCGEPFAPREIPTWVMRLGHLAADAMGPGRCHRCTGLRAPETVTLTEEERNAARWALLDSKAHPERYAGWRLLSNLGTIHEGPGRRPATRGDHAVAQPAEAA